MKKIVNFLNVVTSIVIIAQVAMPIFVYAEDIEYKNNEAKLESPKSELSEEPVNSDEKITSDKKDIKITEIYGNEVRIRGNSSAYRIIAPVPENQQFQVIGLGENLHQSGFRDSEYVSIVQYATDLTTIKNQVSINGIGENSNSELIQDAFNGKHYEIGDYIRIRHAEPSRLDRYWDNELLLKESHQTYVYKMTESGWEIVDNATLWGTSPWEFDESSGVLTIGAGELGEPSSSPWNRPDEYKIGSEHITKIVFAGKVVAPVNSSSLFSKLSNLTELAGLDKLDTSKVTDMSAMFYQSKQLKSLDLSNFDTANVTNMWSLFHDLESIEALDISSFNTEKVTDMRSMFSGMALISKLDLSHFNTDKVIAMDKMFRGAECLTNLNISNFVTKQATMTDMLRYTNLSRITLGDDFQFKSDSEFPAPKQGQESYLVTSNWVREDGASGAVNSIEFMKNYGSGDLMAGTYVGEIRDLSNIDRANDLQIISLPRGNSSKDAQVEQISPHSNFETTGIFLPKGEEITVTVLEENTDLSLNIGMWNIHWFSKLDVDLDSKEFTEYKLSKGTHKIKRDDSDGMVYITNKSYTLTSNLQISGGIEVPRFVLGSNKYTQEHFINRLQETNGILPFGEIEGDASFATIQTEMLYYFDFENKDRLEEFIVSKDEVLYLTNKVYGFNQESGYRANKNLLQRIHTVTPDIGAGYAAATSFRLIFQISTNAAKELVTSEPGDDMWAYWHELGHIYQNANYTFKGLGEVTVNLAAMYIAELYGYGDRTANVKEEVISFLSLPQEEKNYLDINDNFVKLSLFATLARVFGEDFYPTLNQLYRTEDPNRLPKTDEEEIQKMIQMMSQTANRNLVPYFTEWGLYADSETEFICSQYPALEKEIWKDISGEADRYELPGVVPDYTVPTIVGSELSVPLYTAAEDIKGSNFTSNPIASPVRVVEVNYEKIGKNGGTIRVVNENNVFNVIPITVLPTEGGKINWGTSLWEFDESSGVLTIDAGELGESSISPWNRSDEHKIDSEDIKKIVFTGEVIAPAKSSALFSKLSNLTELIGLDKLDTSNVTDMRDMFYQSKQLKSLDLSNFDTAKVTNMWSLFQDLESIESLDLSSFNTESVTRMESLFNGMTRLKSLDISTFSTKNVESMKNMFNRTKLEKLTLGDQFKFTEALDASLSAPTGTGLLTGKWIREDGKSGAYTSEEFMLSYGSGDLTHGSYVAESVGQRWGTSPWEFDESSGVLTIDAGELGESSSSPWNRSDEHKIDREDITKIVFTEKVVAPVKSSALFSELSNLTELMGLDKVDTSKVTDMSAMFYQSKQLKSLDLSNFDTAKVTNMWSLFHNLESIESLDLTSFNTESVTRMESLFNGMTRLKSLDISTFSTKKVDNMRNMFNRTKLEKLTLGDQFKFTEALDASLSAPTGTGLLTGKWIREDGKSGAYTSEEFMLSYGSGDLTHGSYVAESVGQRWGTSPWEFDESSGVLTIDAGELGESSSSPWNRSDEHKIDREDITKIVFTEKVVAPVKSSALFSELSNLTELMGLDKVDTSKVTDMSAMFYQSKQLKSLDLSNFDTAKVTNMWSLFHNLESIESLDLTSFNTESVTRMESLFNGMTRLKSLDISTFSAKKVDNMRNMFNRTKLEKLTLGDQFKFTEALDASLSAPTGTGVLTGKWIREDGKSGAYTSEEFMLSYGSGDLTHGSYVAEMEIKEEFKFKEVPEYFIFKESKLSDKTQEIQRKETDLKMIVQDTRKTKNEWRVTAQLATPFKTSNGDLLMDILYYRIAGQKDQLIGMTDAVTVFTSDGTDSSLIDVQWDEGEGPFLKVAPGMAKRGRYQCGIQWSLIDAPI